MILMDSRYRYTISQIKKSTKLLNKNIDEICRKVGEDTVNKLKTYIKLYWYDRYSPEDYERTYSLKNAVSYEIENQSVYIYIDTDAFVRHKPDIGWGQHVGFDGRDFSEGLVEFVEYGRFLSGKSGSRTNPRIGDGSGAIEKTMNWLNKKVNTEIMNKINIAIDKFEI